MFILLQLSLSIYITLSLFPLLSQLTGLLLQLNQPDFATIKSINHAAAVKLENLSSFQLLSAVVSMQNLCDPPPPHSPPVHHIHRPGRAHWSPLHHIQIFSSHRHINASVCAPSWGVFYTTHSLTLSLEI